MSDDIGPDGLTDQQRAWRAMSKQERRAAYRAATTDHERQAMLELGISLHSTAAGSRKPDLAEPLSDAELATGGGDVPAITNTDCRPRPRYGESIDRFLTRMAAYDGDVAALKRELKQRNRAASLRMVDEQGVTHRADQMQYVPVIGPATRFFTACACGWCGLRVEDPEVARREYDAHACAAESIGQDAVTRAQASVDRPTIMRRTGPAILRPASEHQMHRDGQPIEGELVENSQVDEQVADDATQRFALLEFGK